MANQFSTPRIHALKFIFNINYFINVPKYQTHMHCYNDVSNEFASRNSKRPILLADDCSWKMYFVLLTSKSIEQYPKQSLRIKGNYSMSGLSFITITNNRIVCNRIIIIFIDEESKKWEIFSKSKMANAIA